MYRPFVLAVLLTTVFAGSHPTAIAAGHRDWTVVPLGSFQLDQDEQDIVIRRPYDRFGVIQTPIALLAVPDRAQIASGEPMKITMSIGETTFPEWNIDSPGQIYVIGVEVQQRHATQANAALTMHVRVEGAAAPVQLIASAPPDLCLAGAHWVGPLAARVEQLERGLPREYLTAALASNVVPLDQARAEFARLSESADPRIARYAREKLRRIDFVIAERSASEDFAGHYRLGLYAQQCGLYRHALTHFAMATSFDGASAFERSDALYRLAEAMMRCGEPISRVADVAEQAGIAAAVKANTWDVCLAVLMAEHTDEVSEDGAATEPKRMRPDQIETLKRDWGIVEKMVFGASGGYLRLKTRVIQVPSNQRVAYDVFGGWLPGPADGFLSQRGDVDVVMSFRPGGASVTGGADCGPDGSAMVDIGPERGWEVFLHEWNHSFDWARITGETCAGYPITHHSDGCGYQPIPSMGYGHLSSMRYWAPPGMYQRTELADTDPGTGYVRNWWLGQPHAIDDDPPAQGTPTARHAREFGPDRFSEADRDYSGFDGNFIDLLPHLTETLGAERPVWCVTQATTHVWSPERRAVRLWLGHNDGMAVWVNNELVHRGDYYAIAKFEDQNWPNMACTGALLLQGWNRIDVAVESWPAPFDKGYGFSVRICDYDNHEIPDLKIATAGSDAPTTIAPDALAPRFGRFYKWDQVRDDYYWKLPRITAEDLRDHCGLADGATLSVVSNIGPTKGFLAIGASSDKSDGTLLPIPDDWDRERDRDERVNNIMDYNREAIAVYPFEMRGQTRHLLIMRPEAVGPYLKCLNEAPDAARVYADKPVSDRIVGYLLTGRNIGEQEGVRAWVVAEAMLPAPLPLDEEDLLAPLP